VKGYKNMFSGDKVIYSLNVEDVQTVAREEFGRELTGRELKFVEEEIGGYINWYDIISLVIEEGKDKKKLVEFNSGNLDLKE